MQKQTVDALARFNAHSCLQAVEACLVLLNALQEAAHGAEADG